MKVKITIFIVIIFIMAFLPFITTKCANPNILQTNLEKGNSATKSEASSRQNQTNQEENTQKEENTQQEQNFISKDTLCTLVAQNSKEEYNIETLKALAIIFQTNYLVNSNEYENTNNTENSENTENTENIQEDVQINDNIKTAIDEVYKKTLLQNGKAFYIPFSEISSGATQKSTTYPYLTSVASVWDCFSKNYNQNATCYGVSLNGLNYICENGYDYSKALKWYLPDFSIG